MLNVFNTGLPVAVSFPHFLGGNASLLDRFNGLEPDESKHSSNIIIQPVRIANGQLTLKVYYKNK